MHHFEKTVLHNFNCTVKVAIFGNVLSSI